MWQRTLNCVEGTLVWLKVLFFLLTNMRQLWRTPSLTLGVPQWYAYPRLKTPDLEPMFVLVLVMLHRLYCPLLVLFKSLTCGKQKRQLGSWLFVILNDVRHCSEMNFSWRGSHCNLLRNWVAWSNFEVTLMETLAAKLCSFYQFSCAKFAVLQIVIP